MADRIAAGSMLGDYELIKSLGQGGMAEVFLARQTGINGFQRLVALKVIHPTHSQDASFVEALIQEAKVAVQLNHPNIGQVRDLGKIEDTYFIVMDFIDGRDLYRLLYETSQRNEYLPIEAALYVAEQVAVGLGYCHERKDHYGRPMNLIHRDVSPQNVFLSWEGDVKILDFGIAKVSHRLRQTQAGVIKGKLQYMSPEQISGVPLDARSDLFSCGICLYEMLAGEMARSDGDPLDLLEQIKNAEFRSLKHLRPELDNRIIEVVEKSLSAAPDDRFASGAEFSRALLRLRLELYPDFSPTQFGEYLLSVFDASPFYLDESNVPFGAIDDEPSEQSISMSSSILFGDEFTELGQEEPAESEAGEDTLNLAPDEMANAHESAILEDTYNGADDSQLSQNLGQSDESSSMERTNLFSAPRLDKANPFSDPSTNSGFNHGAQIGQATLPAGRRTLPKQSDTDSPTPSPAKPRAAAQAQMQTVIKPTRKQPQGSQRPLNQQSSDSNPFDATLEERSPIKKSAMSRLTDRFRSFGFQGFVRKMSLSQKITWVSIGMLGVYLVYLATPAVFSSKTSSSTLLRLSTMPQGAQIFIDGQDTSKVSNAEFELSTETETTILVTLDGFQPAELAIESQIKKKSSGKTLERMIKLVPIEGAD